MATPAWARPLKILALGSSLTQGYGLPPGTEFTTQLQAALKAQGIDAEVVNAGVSGDTSADGLSRLDWSLADHPDAAILEMGSNDMLRGMLARRNGKESARHAVDFPEGSYPGAVHGHAGPAQSGRGICDGSSTPSIPSWPRNFM